MKNSKRTLSMILASLLAITAFAGCGSDSSNPSSDSTQSSASEGSETSSAEGTGITGADLVQNGVTDPKYGSGEFIKYDEPITITFGAVFDPQSDSILAMAENGEPLENNRWIQYFRDEMNIECEYEICIGNSSDYNQRILLLSASGGLPDIFLVADLSQLNQLADAGAITDMTQIYADNASTTLLDTMEYEGTNIYESTLVNGQMYGIPCKMPSTNGYNHCWVRQDWLDECGLDRPETMDDVMNIAQTFKDNYENNIGLMLSKDYLSESKGIFWAFGGKTSTRNYWQTLEDGTVAFSEVQPEMKGGLAWLRDMYAAGLINQEFATQDITTAFEYVANNQCGIFFGPHWYGFRMQTAEGTLSEGADWVAVGLPTGIEGETTKVYATNTKDGVYCVNSDFEHPEALVQMLNAYAEKLFGENNDFSNFFACDENSGLWNASPVHVLHPMCDLEPHLELAEAYENGTMDQLTGTAADYRDYIDSGLTAYKYMFGPVDSCFNFVADTYPDIIEWNAYTGAPTPSWVDHWGTLQELIDTTYLQIIQGTLDLDTGFDQMVQQWNDLGGADITKEVNEIVASYSE